MKLKIVTIENYRSIGERIKIYLDDATTTIIGKNETGKSNIINILSQIDLKSGKGLPLETLNDKHQSSESKQARVSLEFRVTEDDIAGYSPLKTADHGIAVIDTQNNIKFKNGFTEYFSTPEIGKTFSVLKQYYDKLMPHIKDDNVKRKLNECLTELRTSSIKWIPFESTLNFIDKNLPKSYLADDEINDIKMLYEQLFRHFYELYKRFPVFYKFVETPLNSTYTIDATTPKSTDSKYQGLQKLASVAGFTLDELVSVCENYPHNGTMPTKKRIIKLLKENVELGFNDFYKQERIAIEPEFARNAFHLFIESTGAIITLSERSSGLRWYLNLYLDMLDKKIMDVPVVFLIDEPGIQLHVEAQKQLVSLFSNLSKNSQIVYTTHSPFMLNKDAPEIIRVLQKDVATGQTKVCSIFDDRKINGASRMEGLSPVVHALGMQLSDNIGMSSDKINVIVEGPSDTIYLTTMAKRLERNDFAFICACGAANIKNIMTILWAWGMQWRIVYDNDKAGRRQYNDILKKIGQNNFGYSTDNDSLTNIHFISDGLSQIDESKQYVVENLIRDEDKNNAGFIETYDTCEKVLNASRFRSYVSNHKNELTKETIANFARLFEELLK